MSGWIHFLWNTRVETMVRKTHRKASRKLHRKTNRKHTRKTVRKYRGGVNENEIMHQGTLRQIMVPFYSELPQEEVNDNGNVQIYNPMAIARDIQRFQWDDGKEALENAQPNVQGNVPNQVIVDNIKRYNISTGQLTDNWIYKIVRSPNGDFTHHIYRHDALYRISMH